MIFRRKIYDRFLAWKNESKGTKARLHDGEVEVMILAQECDDDALVIIDDDAAKRLQDFLI